MTNLMTNHLTTRVRVLITPYRYTRAIRTSKFQPMKYKIKYAGANARRTYHKKNPEKSAQIQRIATLAHQKKCLDKKNNLLFVLKKQPYQLTPEELTEFILTLRYYNPKGKRKKHDSMIRRLRRYGFISYDTLLGKWINLTLLQLPEP